MSNKVSIPPKKSPYSPQIKHAVRDYIQIHHRETSPDAFRWDIEEWGRLRKDALATTIHIDRVDKLLKYYAQLTWVLTKFPADMALDFSYAPAFQASTPATTLSNLAFERACVLFNLASLYSNLALLEDHTRGDGIKRANAFLQSAAGALSHLISSDLPPLQNSLTSDQRLSEFTEPFLRALEFIMLAQAQEGAWQKAVMDSYKNGVIAKLAAKVSSFYASAGNSIREAPSDVRKTFPAEWLAYVDTKSNHFAAAAQFRQSVNDLEANHYGSEIARLLDAQVTAKRGYDIARRGNVPPAVLSDIKSLMDIIQNGIKRAERDNDLIYHQDVPPISSLPAVQATALAQSVVPAALKDPQTVVANNEVLFGDLLSFGARLAIELYEDRRQNYLKELVERAEELKLMAEDVLQACNLPASLDALDKPIGLPPSLLRKAEEVRLQSGPARIDKQLTDVEFLSHRNRSTLEQVMDLLDQEASEDEGLRGDYQRKHGVPSPRPPSYEVNLELTAKEKRYRQVLDEAAQSDVHVRNKWYDWEESILRLTWDESTLDKWVPSSTLGASGSQDKQTTIHARSLRAQLETLDGIFRSRDNQISRARQMCDNDDIRPRIMREATGLARWTNVDPAMFEDTLDQELAKYDKYKDAIENGGEEQVTLLNDIETTYGEFIQSRREDESVKEREHALQSLDLAYHKYREIVRNLEEGMKFYNDLASILAQYQEAAKEWVRSRRDDMSALAESIRGLDIASPPAESKVHSSKDAPPPAHVPATAPDVVLTPPSAKPTKKTFALPPPDSDEWETMPTPTRSNNAAPSPKKSKRT